jgi:hypothetical protein
LPDEPVVHLVAGLEDAAAEGMAAVRPGCPFLDRNHEPDLPLTDDHSVLLVLRPAAGQLPPASACLIDG